MGKLNNQNHWCSTFVSRRPSSYRSEQVVFIDRFGGCVLIIGRAADKYSKRADRVFRLSALLDFWSLVENHVQTPPLGLSIAQWTYAVGYAYLI